MNDESDFARPSASVCSRLRTAIAVMLAFGVALAIVVPMVRIARESARKAQRKERLQHIAMAIDNFRDTYGALPPAYVLDSEGRPLHSWRVLIVPFIEKNWFYDMYRLDEPWDGPNNRLLHDVFIIDDDGFGQSRDITEVRQIYRCPDAPASRQKTTTNYVMIVDTVSPPTETPSHQWWLENTRYYPADSSSVMVVEIRNSDIHWMEPRDLSLDEMGVSIIDPLKPGISSQDLGGAFVLLANGTVTFLDELTTKERLKEMLHVTQPAKAQ